jgi:hypothetical protein
LDSWKKTDKFQKKKFILKFHRLVLFLCITELEDKFRIDAHRLHMTSLMGCIPASGGTSLGKGAFAPPPPPPTPQTTQ